MERIESVQPVDAREVALVQSLIIVPLSEVALELNWEITNLGGALSLAPMSLT